ncbi:MAG: UDP-3-O-(3-hydroxymyristoyl)glucosamine N-acyltransferase [Thermoanaerobaculia bacterium]
MAPTLGELAARVGGEVVGDPRRIVDGVRTLGDAGERDLALVDGPKNVEAARASRAGSLLVERPLAGLERDFLVVAKPRRALVDLLDVFHPPLRPPAGIAPSAVVGAGSTVDPSATIGPYAVVGEGCRIGADAVIGAHAVVGAQCVLGAGTVLHPHVVLYDRTELGERVVVHAGTVLGSDGFGYVTDGGAHVKVPQVGRVVVGDDVEIGALTAIDRATLGATRIGGGTKIDNLVQVGHNVEIGRACVLCGQAGIAGSAKLGDGVVLAGQSGSAGHLEIGAGAQVAAKSAVLQSVGRGERVAGIPAVALSKWRRQQALLQKLGGLMRRLRDLERAVGIEEGDKDRDDG